LDEFGTDYAYTDYGNINLIDTPTSSKDIEIIYEAEYKTDIDYYFDEQGIMVNFTTNSDGFIESVTKNNITSTYQYNSINQNIGTQIGSELGEHFKTSIDYTADFQYLNKYIDEFDSITSFEYDHLTGLIRLSKDSSNVDTVFKYDDFGRLIETSKAGSKNEYIYVNNELKYIKVNNEYAYLFVYNELGQVKDIHIGTGLNVTPLISYENLEEIFDSTTYYTNILKKQTYANGDYIEFEYNDEYQLTKVLFKGVEKYQYDYNQYGRLTIYNDLVNDKQYYYSYDLTGRLREVTDKEGNTYQYTYDSKGNFTEVEYNIDGRVETTQYIYDEITNRYLGVKQGTIEKNYIYNLDSESLQRLSAIHLNTGNKIIQQTITYDDSKVIHGNATMRIKELSYNIGYDFSYSYDNRGNINQIFVVKAYTVQVKTKVCQMDEISGVIECFIVLSSETRYRTKEKHDYQYDSLNQLIREDFYLLNGDSYTMVYTYDNQGNITLKEKCLYQPEITNIAVLSGVATVIGYEYASLTWKDQLTNYDGTVILYDDLGNPTKIEKDTSNYILLDWEGRTLVGYTEYQNGSLFQIITYKYDDMGYRTYKKIDKLNGNYDESVYYLDGSMVIYEEIKHYLNNSLTTTDNIHYTYDIDGSLISMNLNNVEYFYIRNLQGDIVNIVDSSGIIKVEYVYDAWGNIIHTTDNTGTLKLAEKNPYRYRGYHYDNETGLYYLNSRYYNPEIGRFINADGLIGEVGDILGHNMYAYCGNNPVMRIDPTGYFWDYVFDGVFMI